MSRFEQVWSGVPEPTLRPSRVALQIASPPGVARLRAFGQALVAPLASPPTQLAINQAKLRLTNRLDAELSLVGAVDERLALFEAFAALIRELSERELDVVPPELIERVVVYDPAPTVSTQQAIGFFLADEEG